MYTGLQSQESVHSLLALALTADGRVSRAALERLLRDYAEPVIRKVTRSRGVRDEEEVRSMATVHLIARLDVVRRDGASIEDFSAYVAGIAQNCCNQILRETNPEYARLKNRVRYLLNHRPHFKLSSEDGDGYLCGLTEWRREGVSASKAAAGPLDLTGFVMPRAHLSAADGAHLEELLAGVLDWCGRPVLLDDLVATVAHLAGVRDVHHSLAARDSEETDIGELLPDVSVDVAWEVELRSELTKLWVEIRELPRPQRVALLLNLRDSQQRDALMLLPLTGVAGLPEMAAVLELPLSELAVLWNRLPLDDLSIAQLLGMSRQQVINLRKSARQRLARRMATAD
jgi:hypothetical protein